MTGRLMWGSRALWVALGLVALTGCSSTRLIESWSPPDAPLITFRKVIVVCISQNNVTRRVAEDAMVRQILEAEATPSYQLIPDAELRDTARVETRIAAAGFDGAVTMRLLAVDKRVTWVPGYHQPHYRSFGGYFDRAWPGAYDRGRFEVDQIVRIETNVYSVKDNRLIWAGTSETFNPASVETVVEEIASEVAKDLRKRGLLKQKEQDAVQR